MHNQIIKLGIKQVDKSIGFLLSPRWKIEAKQPVLCQILVFTTFHNQTIYLRHVLFIRLEN